MKLRRLLAPLALTAVAVLGLSGCGELSPGSASVVGGERITHEEVDDLVAAQCTAADAAAKSGGSGAVAVSQVRQQSLGVLMDTALSMQYAEDQGITPDKQIAAALFDQFEPTIATLPESSRGELSKVFKEWALGRSAMIEAGSRASGQPVTADAAQQLMSAGLAAREKWLSSIDITTDARYSPAANGFPGGGDGSVSRPTSDFAKGATSTEADAAWVGGLPAGQKCG